MVVGQGNDWGGPGDGDGDGKITFYRKAPLMFDLDLGISGGIGGLGREREEEARWVTEKANRIVNPLWRGYAKALAGKKVEHEQTDMDDEMDLDQDPEGDIRRVSVEFSTSRFSGKLSPYDLPTEHMYVNSSEGFALPGLELVEVDMGQNGGTDREPEIRVRFRWREVVTVLLQRAERGPGEEERRVLERRAKFLSGPEANQFPPLRGW